MCKAVQIILWISVAALGAFAYFVVAFHRGEPLNAGWLLMAAICTYAIGYRFYSKWIAARLLTLNDRRATPCEAHEDGRDYVKINKWIVFGHHFAAISGPGPLVGPVLAAQFGYLPGTIWILIGVVLGGAVQDFLILFCSIRRDGKSLGEMVKEEINSTAGVIALLAIVSIMIILIAVLGLVVVKALAQSPWGTFTIAATIPIAFFMGCYLRFFRVGHVLEVTAIGVILLLLSVWGGGVVQGHPTLSHFFTLSGPSLAWAIIIYGLTASILPVWLLLAPRDYLSTFMKLGTMMALAVGIFIVLPPLRLPPLTKFIDGTGPIFAGSVFPFCFITIACGAISGFHSLIASGTTPKIITRESYARSVGYGSMLLESAVAIMAIIASCTLQPGIYFAVNSPAAAVGKTPEQAVQTISSWGFPITTREMSKLAHEIGESNMFGRTGGAPTLAVGMAHIFSKLLGGSAGMALWYHFAIMFEALFILTTVDAGTRVGRFLIQALLGYFWKPLGNIYSYPANIFSSFLLVSAWGYFMYQGVIDPLGGINSLWPLFGIANQLLAVVAFCLGTTVLIKMQKKSFVWVTFLPLSWLLAVTFTAGLEKIFHSNPKIGFLSQAKHLSAQLNSGAIALDQIEATKRILFNIQLDAITTGFFLALVGTIVLISTWRWIYLWTGRSPLDLREVAPVWLPKKASSDGVSQGVTGRFWALGVLGLSLLKHFSGQTQLDRVRDTTVCYEPSTAYQPSSANQQGRLWAEMEEKRYSSPRCC